MTLFQLYECMYDKGYEMYDYRLGGEKAATICLNNRYAVFIDTDLIANQADELTTVAHEFGHCETGCLHKIDSPLDTIARHEYRANKWAVHHVSPPEEIKKAIRSGCSEVWQIAEYLELPEDFIRLALYIYKCEELIA